MFKAFGFTATMHRQSWFMCRFHMSREELHRVSHGSPKPWHNLSKEHVLPFTQVSPGSLCFLSHCYNTLGNLSFPSPPHQPIYSHPLPVHLSLTRGQVCPCVASSNRKCIMDVTFLSISTTKSRTPLCSQ